MRALYLTSPRNFAWLEAPPAEPPPGWVRVRMRYVGICGSDIHYFETGRIGDQIVRYPFVLGHEGSGEILDGAGKLSPGLPAYVEPAIVCHDCDQCRAGRENTCRNLKFLGNPLETEGCMREEIAMPPDCIVPIPEWMGLEEAVLLEPLSIGAYAVARSGCRPGTKAAVVGAGPIGLSVLLAVQEIGSGSVFMSEPVAERRRAASELGAQTTFDPSAGGAADAVRDASGGGVDLAFECCGSQEAIDDATGMLCPGGILVLIGIPEGNDRMTYDPHLARRREITIVNIRRQNGMTERAISILGRRRDAARALITHRFTADQAREGFELVQRKANGVVKALLEF